MYIKQWLQEPLQKRQCEMIIDEILWELNIKPKTVEKKVDSMGVNDFYQQLLDYKFDEELEFRFMQCLQTLGVRTVPLDKILAVFGIQSLTVQDMMSADGTTKKGLDHDAACIVFHILCNIVGEKYAVI